MPGHVNGFSLGYTALGAVVMWSGIRGWKISDTFHNLLSGKTPTSSTEPIATSAGSAASGNTGNSPGQSDGTYNAATGNQNSRGATALQQAAAAYGWQSGPEWTALQYVEMREAGFNSHAKNSSSGALGMAQALGHGNANTAGTLGNEYGGYGLTDAQAKLANSGNDFWQAVWMVNYIAQTYQDPITAANHERQYNWY